MLVYFRGRLFHLDGQPELLLNDGEVRLYLTGKVRDEDAFDYLDGLWAASRHNTALRVDDGLALRFVDRRTGKATFELVCGSIPLVRYRTAFNFVEKQPTDQEGDKLHQIWRRLEMVNRYIASDDHIVFDESGRIVPRNAEFVLEDDLSIEFYSPELPSGFEVVYYHDEEKHKSIEEVLDKIIGGWRVVRRDELRPLLEVI